MKLLDLFAGIGGFSLAAHWMGWETVAFVEWDKFCQKVLRKNFGDIPIYDDIRDFDGTQFRGHVDIITGGFPCQPFSAAGKQKGKSDQRYLFPEMLRVIGEVRPRYIVAENVRGLLSIENGEVFTEISSQLEGQGYNVWTFGVPASAVEAPHERLRVWVVCNADSGDALRERVTERSSPYSPEWPSTQNVKAWEGWVNELVSRNVAQRADSYADALRVLDGIPERMDRLKSLGNTVVPQIAYEIFQSIK